MAGGAVPSRRPLFTIADIRDAARGLRFAIPLLPGYILDIFTQRGWAMAGKKILMLVGDYAEDSENI